MELLVFFSLLVHVLRVLAVAGCAIGIIAIFMMQGLRIIPDRYLLLVLMAVAIVVAAFVVE